MAAIPPRRTRAQTSGGLLVACAANSIRDVIAQLERHAFERAAIVGEMTGVEPLVVVET